MSSKKDKETGGSLTFTAPVDVELIRERKDQVRLELETFAPTDLITSDFSLSAEALKEHVTPVGPTIHLPKGHSSLILHVVHGSLLNK